MVIDLYHELWRTIRALDEAGIPYALIGGLAVSIYTAPRATEDIDLVVGPRDLSRAIEALTALGLRAAGAPMRVAGGRLEIQRLIRTEGNDLLQLDLLVLVDPALAHVFETRRQVTVEGTLLSIVDVAALRELKRLRGSAQDRADLEALEGKFP
jgi:hypothetical protein